MQDNFYFLSVYLYTYLLFTESIILFDIFNFLLYANYTVYFPFIRVSVLEIEFPNKTAPFI